MSKTDLHPVSLRFADPILEAEFLDDYSGSSIRQVRWALLLGIVIYGFLFGISDYLAAVPQREAILYVRVVVCLIALGVFLFTYSRYFRRFVQVTLSLVAFLAGLGLIGMIVIDREGAYLDGPALLILASYVFLRLRFVPAAAISWVLIIIYVAVVFLVELPAGTPVVRSAIYLIAANFIGMYAGYVLERSFRVDYRKTRLLDAKREEEARARKELETAYFKLDASHQQLEEAHQNLTNTQLRLVQSEKLASLGQLTAGIAHEIKNPLNFINNFAEVNTELAEELEEALAKGEPVEEVLKDLVRNQQVIAQHGRRADAIVRAMMQHASGSKTEREAVDVNTFVEEYVNLAYHGIKARIPNCSLHIERNYADDAGHLTVQPQELGRVLLNLLKNAIDAVRDRREALGADFTPVVRVTTERTSEAVVIRVTDNGIGIPEDVRDRIFEPFFTTKPSGEGTGLGLSLSHEIVVQGHGGALTVESEPGRGTTFIVTLPVTVR